MKNRAPSRTQQNENADHRRPLWRRALGASRNVLAILLTLGVATPGAAQVQLFYLLDGVTETEIRTLEDQDEVDLVTMGAAKLNLAAVVHPPADGVVDKVEFFDNTNGMLLRTDFVKPWTLFEEGAPVMLEAGDYDIEVVGTGTDGDGVVKVSDLEILLSVSDDGPADMQAPDVAIIYSPVDGLTYYDPKPWVGVLAADDQAVGRVEFFVDSLVIPAATVYPTQLSSFEWAMTAADGSNLTDGTHSVFARVYDVTGNVTNTAPVSFTKRSAPAAVESVTVQFDQSIATWGKSRIGFNHGITSDTPEEEFLEDELVVGTLREGNGLFGDPNLAPRLEALGADLFALTEPKNNSDTWWDANKPADAAPDFKERPYDMNDDGVDEYDAYIAHLINLVNTKYDVLDVETTVFEMWNEPALGGWGNASTNFHGTQKNFFGTLDVWLDTMRSHPSDLRLAAPGHGTGAAFNPHEIEAMMKHLQDGGRSLDVLTLHNLTPQDRFQLSRDTLVFYRDRYIDNAAANGFDDVDLQEIVLNEYLTPIIHFFRPSSCSTRSSSRASRSRVVGSPVPRES